MQISQNINNLFEELGGETGAFQRVHGILEGFYEKISKDTMLGFFFAGKDLPHIVEQQKNFLLRALGAKIEFTGNPPARAHFAIAPILQGHFDRRLLLLREHLKNSGLSESSVNTWVSFENQFRKLIVKEEGPLSR